MSLIRTVLMILPFAALGVAGISSAANITVNLAGEVTVVEESPLAPGQGPSDVFVGDPVSGTAEYDDTTAQTNGSFTSYELTSLILVIPDAGQGGGNFSMIPASVNSATRIIFEAGAYHGLVLPDNVTDFDNTLDIIDPFGFDDEDVDFEADGFLGSEFRFNVGSPVVEFPEPGFLAMLFAGTGLVGALQRRRSRR